MILAMTLPLLGAGCVNAGNDAAICDGSKQDRREHAAALAIDGGNLSVVTGARLIRRIDAGCGE